MTKATSSKTETNVIIDPSDPFYLHCSDHPGISLVTKPLNGDNYATWSRSMSIALILSWILNSIDPNLGDSVLYTESAAEGLWDELSSYNDMPICSCGAIKGSEEQEQREKLLHLTGLGNEEDDWSGETT
ncbi:hypothetical protein WN943_006230 [Citrus x changshan-huyou]